MSALAVTIEKPISSTQSAANVVSLRRPGQRPGRRELVTGSNGRASTVARRSLAAAAGDLSRWSGPAVAVDDFAPAGGQAIETHEASTAEVHLTLADLFVTAFLLISALSPPVLVWLMLRTAF
jgi:hypothetical protein